MFDRMAGIGNEKLIISFHEGHPWLECQMKSEGNVKVQAGAAGIGMKLLEIGFLGRNLPGKFAGRIYRFKPVESNLTSF